MLNEVNLKPEVKNYPQSSFYIWGKMASGISGIVVRSSQLVDF